MGKDEDFEEEGGTAEVIPVEVWTYWENAFKAKILLPHANLETYHSL